MKRTEIRTIINEYLETNRITILSAELASELEELLKTKFPNKKYSNEYIIKSEYEVFLLTKLLAEV